jgi:Fe-S cluster assembly iron-binding protein IscA
MANPLAAGGLGRLLGAKHLYFECARCGIVPDRERPAGEQLLVKQNFHRFLRRSAVVFAVLVVFVVAFGTFAALTEATDLPPGWIKLTPLAQEHAREIIRAQGGGAMRLSLDEDGRLGFALGHFAFHDRRVDQGDVRVLLSETIADAVKGLEIDWANDRDGFRFSGTAPALARNRR